jgi:RimJ/RimL family protein N-acetyltransferase
MDALLAQARLALDAVPLNTGFARAALALPGADLWVDRTREPRAFHVRHPYGMSLVWGPDVPAVIAEVLTHLRTRPTGTPEEWLQIDPRAGAVDWDAALDAVPHDSPAAQGARAVRHTRVNFRYDPDARRSPLAPPPGWRTRRATAADFDRPGEVVPQHFWPDAPTFLAHGGGTVVERDGRFGAMAFTSYRTGADVEIGIETAPDLRRRGLAAAAAAAMTDAVVADGLTPVWSCREDNVGSLRLAVALGFVPTVRAGYFRLRAPVRRGGECRRTRAPSRHDAAVSPLLSGLPAPVTIGSSRPTRDLNPRSARPPLIASIESGGLPERVSPRATQRRGDRVPA